MKDSDSGVLVRFAYTRDAAGNPTAIDRESGLGVFYYEYDALQRLIGEGAVRMSLALKYATYYEYDGAGNRRAMVHVEGGGGAVVTYYTYNAANELTERDPDRTTYQYDANGNMYQQASASSGGQYFHWDSRDLLQAYGYGEPDSLKYYYYDGMGSRVASRESVGLTYYDWDGINVLQEKTEP